MMKAETLEAVKQLVEEFKEEGFRPILWISVPCSPWCTWQRVNVKAIEGFKEDLDARRAESLAMIEGITGLLEKVKVESYFEWPKRNDGWKKEEVQKMIEYIPYTSEVDGCAYNLKNSEGRPLKKTWRIQCTHGRVTKYLNKTCSCREEHAQVRGKDGKATENYTDELVKEAVDCILNVKNTKVKQMKKEMTKAGVGEASEGRSHTLRFKMQRLFVGRYQRPTALQKART